MKMIGSDSKKTPAKDQESSSFSLNRDLKVS